MKCVISFGRYLPPVSNRITLIKIKHRPEDILEVERQIRYLVRDVGRKLHARNNRLYAERAEGALATEDTEPETKCSSLATVRFAIPRLVPTIF